MLSRENFVFTIGYDGPAAVVDAQAKRKYGKLNTRELAEKGLFRAAYASALYANDPGELAFVAGAFSRMGGASPSDSPGNDPSAADLSEADLSALNRLFGVFPVDVNRVVAL